MAETAHKSAGISKVCERHGNEPSHLIEILHDIQAENGYVPEEALPQIARALNLSRAEVHGVMSFYHDFKKAPAGKVTVKVCRAEACQSMGAETLIAAICARLGISLGETTRDGVTIEPVYCLGNCGLSPAAMIDGRLVGRLDEGTFLSEIEEAQQ